MNETPITLGQLMQVIPWQFMPVCLNIETEPLGYEYIYITGIAIGKPVLIMTIFLSLYRNIKITL